MGKTIKLKAAVGTPDHENGIFNDYKWYLWNARSFGKIRIGRVDIPTRKEKGHWVLDNSDLIRAIESFKKEKTESEKSSNIFEEKQPSIDSGGYLNNSNFRLVRNAYDLARKRSDGTWYCNTCYLPAETEHNNTECHTCSDWNGCGNDCTLSRVYCRHCEKELRIGGIR